MIPSGIPEPVAAVPNAKNADGACNPESKPGKSDVCSIALSAVNPEGRKSGRQPVRYPVTPALRKPGYSIKYVYLSLGMEDQVYTMAALMSIGIAGILLTVLFVLKSAR